MLASRFQEIEEGVGEVRGENSDAVLFVYCKDTLYNEASVTKRIR